MTGGVKMGDTPQEFEAIARRSFGFLEDEAGLKGGSARIVNEGYPRDEALVLRYSSDDIRVDIAWAAHELALMIGVRFDLSALSRRERHVYFESYVEFISNGTEKPIVPYLVGPGIRRPFQRIMNERQQIFKEGLSPVMGTLAAKLRNHLADLEAATPESVRAYHAWIAMNEAR